MRKILVLITILFPFRVFSQAILTKDIIGEWVKTDIRLSDNSPIFTPATLAASFRYIFKPAGIFMMVYNGRTINSTYQVNGNQLTLGNDSGGYTIEKLSSTQLVLQENDAYSSDVKLKFYLEPAALHNIGFVPESFISKGNDTIYVAKRNILEPFFIDASQNIMEFIYANFAYPDYRKGTFLLRFIITNKGELKAPKVLEGSEEKYNDRLLKALKKTIGKWQAAIWDNQPVNTEMTLFFDMKPPINSDSDTLNKEEISNNFFSVGTDFFEQKNYRQALEFYNKSITTNPYHVNAYYNRAATYIMLHQKDAACRDFKTLVQLQQKRAEDLLKKFCDN